ncbi:hypothetical protein EX30DRAFT_375203, partial [Ascodesmis nigricans]
GAPDSPITGPTFAPTTDFTLRLDKDFLPTTILSDELHYGYSPTEEFVDEKANIYEPVLEYVYEDSKYYEPVLEYVYEDAKYYEPTEELIYEDVKQYAPTNEYVIEFVDSYAPTYEVELEMAAGPPGEAPPGKHAKGRDPVNWNCNNNLNNFEINIGAEDIPTTGDEYEEEGKKAHGEKKKGVYRPESVARLQEDTPTTAHANIPEIRVQRLKNGDHEVSSVVYFPPVKEKAKFDVVIDDPEEGEGRVEVFEAEKAPEGGKLTWKRRPERGRKVGCWDTEEERWSLGDGKVRAGKGEKVALEFVWAGEDGGGVLWGVGDVRLVEVE